MIGAVVARDRRRLDAGGLVAGLSRYEAGRPADVGAGSGWPWRASSRCASRILQQVHPDPGHRRGQFSAVREFRRLVGSGLRHGFQHSVFRAASRARRPWARRRINPRRNIPIALLGTVLGSGVFFIFVAYCEVIGFGSHGIADLGQLRSAAQRSGAALRLARSGDRAGSGRRRQLLLRRAGAALRPRVASCLLWAARGSRPALGERASVARHPGALPCRWRRLTDHSAVRALGAVRRRRQLSTATTSTIGVLALILVYIGVGGAEVVEAWREQRRCGRRSASWGRSCCCGCCTGISIRCRTYPNNLWPYVALAWVARLLGADQTAPGRGQRATARYSALIAAR